MLLPQVCSLLENHSEAIDLQKEAVHILNEMYGPDHTYTLTETAVLTVCGNAYMGLGFFTGSQHAFAFLSNSYSAVCE